ncbi:MAG: hypothetical protein ACTHNW_16230 [Mucilaginibacter sp.]
MIRSVLQKPKKYWFLTGLILLALLHLSFTVNTDEQQLLDWSNKCFFESYDPSGDAKLKKWDLVLTNDAFIRLRKTYQNGKQEYFSFQLHRLDNMNYTGTADEGTLQFKTVADDIIVQTYNDRNGDIDSMATQLDIPVKNMQPERLDSLKMVINYFKSKEL